MKNIIHFKHNIIFTYMSTNKMLHIMLLNIGFTVKNITRYQLDKLYRVSLKVFFIY